VSAPIRYLDVCSGYSAFTVASAGMGFRCAGYAEVDAFPSALLGHHYGAGRARYMPNPDAPFIDAKERKARLGLIKSMASLRDSHFGNRVTNFGDFTQIREDDVGPVDLLIGGTPCQAFSVAGKRLGLDDPRGNLTLEFLALARRLRVPWLAWENVHGFLSHDEGRTMGTFLRLLGELGYGWAYRVLDVQYIRVGGSPRAIPQRRRRVFVVAHFGDQAGPAAVLFDRESLRGDPAPRRETGEGVARPLASGSPSSSGYRNVADTAQPLMEGGPVGGNQGGDYIAFSVRGRDGEAQAEPAPEGLSPSLRTGGGGSSHAFVADQWAVRRLTPTECERLMGVPDGFSAITYRGKPAADGPRYKALGNSQGVNVMRWIAHGLRDVIDAQATRIAA